MPSYFLLLCLVASPRIVSHRIAASSSVNKFNDHITTALSDDSSELSEAPTNATTPFTIAARSVASSAGPKPAERTRNVATRRGVIPPKSSQKKPTLQIPTPRAPDDHSPLVPIPINVQESENVEEDLSEDPDC